MAIRVNGELIEDDRFHRAFLQLSGGRTPEQVALHEFQPMLQQAEQTVLRETLLLQLAVAEGLSASSEQVEQERKAAWGSAANQSCGTGITHDMERRILLRTMEQHLTRHVPRPDRREVEAMYRNNPAAFTLPERWLVSHIVKLAETVDERIAAEAALQSAEIELQRGKSFAAVADRYSDCRGTGGALSWITRGSMVAEFEAVAFTLELRKRSGIFATPFGLHIALVQDHRAAGLEPLDEIRNDLARRIHDDRKQTHLGNVVQDLYYRATVELIEAPPRSVAEGEKVQ